MKDDVQNLSPEGETLDQLRAALGVPSPTVMRLAFRGGDEAWMLRQGQSIASETILSDGAAFVSSTRSVWGSLPAEKRQSLYGYTVALDAVVVHELLALRAQSHGYDVLAQGASSSVGRRRQDARDAFASGVVLRLAVHQTLRDNLGASHPIMVGLASSMKPADTSDVLANGLDGLATTLHTLLHGSEKQPVDRELAADLNAVMLDDALVARIRDAAKRIRETATLAEVKPQDLAAAQRALDLQDGRVLHVIGLVVRAFRRARRADPTLLVPELGDLERIYGGTGGHADDTDADPTPTPTPAPVA